MRAALLEEFFKFTGFLLAKRSLKLWRKIDTIMIAGLIGLVYGVVEKAVLGSPAAVFIGLAIPMHITWQFNPAGPVPDFFLPDALTTIESEAFRDISALTVVIPKNVQTIASNAFEDSDVMYVYGFPGTAAETWADGNALTFFSLTDAWYARLKAR